MVSSKFWVDDVTMLSQNFKTLTEGFHKQIIHPKVPFNFDFHFCGIISTSSTISDLFDLFLGWWSNLGKAKLQNFKIMVSKTDTFFTIDFHLSITIGKWNTSLGPFWPNFWLMTSTRESKLKFFEKAISETKFLNCKVLSNIDFDLSISRDSQFGSSLSNLERMTSQNK